MGEEKYEGESEGQKEDAKCSFWKWRKAFVNGVTLTNGFTPGSTEGKRLFDIMTFI